MWWGVTRSHLDLGFHLRSISCKFWKFEMSLNFLSLSFLIFIEGIHHLSCRIVLRIGIKQLKYLAQSDFNTFKFHITFSNFEKNPSNMKYIYNKYTKQKRNKQTKKPPGICKRRKKMIRAHNIFYRERDIYLFYYIYSTKAF